MHSNDLILVLGSARSGTSALTRVISLCGCSLPQSVFGASSLNPTGHWEPVDVTHINIEFASRHGIVADPSIRLHEIDISVAEKERFIRTIQEFLSGHARRQPLVIKEFRLNELMDFWLEAARRDGLTAKAVIAFRHPQEVFASAKAGGHHFRPRELESGHPTTTSLETSNALWLKVNLLAERNSRSIPRVFVDYSKLLKDWPAEVARMSKALSTDLRPDKASIDGFLTNDLHRQQYSGPITETFGHSWMTRVHSILSSATRDEPIDTSLLDDIYDEYRASARAFRIAFHEVGSRPNVQQLREFVDSLPVWNSGSEY